MVQGKVRRIVLLCSAGVSTSMLVRKMEAEAARLGYPCSVSFYPVSEVQEAATFADVMLLAPQAASNLPEFQESYEKTAKAYMEQYGFHEIARRYAINLANGRYLWRNRLSAEEIEVHVTDDVHTWVFSAYDFPWKDFEEDDLTDEEKQDIKEPAAEIADALRGKKSSAFFHIDAYARVGEGQEVYPSQELVLDTNSRKNEKGKKSKILYQVDGIAAMHSQKIGNALRTIDTWYPAYEKKLGPIAVEPYGAVTSRSQAFRTSKEKADFYTLFDSYALGNQLSTEEDEHYVMAMLVRGGVFGQGSKENE